MTRTQSCDATCVRTAAHTARNHHTIAQYHPHGRARFLGLCRAAGGDFFISTAAARDTISSAPPPGRLLDLLPLRLRCSARALGNPSLCAKENGVSLSPGRRRGPPWHAPVCLLFPKHARPPAGAKWERRPENGPEVKTHCRRSRGESLARSKPPMTAS